MGEEGNVQVVARFRPFSDKEVLMGRVQESEELFEFGGKSVKVAPSNQPSLKFVLNQVFDTKATQADVYGYFGANCVDQMLAGFNVTIFAYGQTGAGKSFSMLGDAEDQVKQGLIPRVAGDIFRRISEIAGSDSSVEFTISCSYLEVYQEQIQDLLSRNSKNLAIRESPTHGVYVEGLSVEYVGSASDILDLLAIGDRMKKVASTNMNLRSSRSHSCFVCKIIQRDDNDCTKEAKLNLVDLAGSERIKKTGASGQTLEEAKKINLSLTCLSQCINALTDSTKSHVPFRGSKLTRLLQESLGGNSKTTVLVACSPHIDNMEETICTLRFAERCKKVTNNAKENIQLSPAQLTKMCQQLSEEIVGLKSYTAVLEGTLTRLGVNPRGLDSGSLQLGDGPKKVFQTVDNFTQMSPRETGNTQDLLITTYENQTVIVPSKHLMEQKRLNDFPPPGQTYITSTVKLEGYSPKTFGDKEQDAFLRGVVATLDNDEITVESCVILAITAGSVNVTFRVEAPTFLSGTVTELIQSVELSAGLAKAGINTKGLRVTKVPAVVEGVVRPKDLESNQTRRPSAVPVADPSLDMILMMQQPKSEQSDDNSKLEKLSNQVLDLKTENESLLSVVESQKKRTEEVEFERDQAQLQIAALHDKINSFAKKFQEQQPLDDSDLRLLRDVATQSKARAPVSESPRKVAIVPEPRVQSGSTIVFPEPETPKPRLGGRRHQGIPVAQRRGRKVDATAINSADLSTLSRTDTSDSDSTARTSRRVPQLFVPMDEAGIRGEYKTFVATEFSVPDLARRRDDDESDAISKVKEFQEAIDRQSDIIERQSVLLAHQEKLYKQATADMETIRKERAMFEAKVAEYEMRILDAAREGGTQPGVPVLGNRPKNIRVPVRAQESVLGGSLPIATSVRTSRTQRTARAKQQDTNIVSGMLSMFSEILEGGNESPKQQTLSPATPSSTQRAMPSTRGSSRLQRSTTGSTPASHRRATAPKNSDEGKSKFNVAKMFGL